MLLTATMETRQRLKEPEAWLTAETPDWLSGQESQRPGRTHEAGQGPTRHTHRTRLNKTRQDNKR